jgi:hypothetical protein
VAHEGNACAQVLARANLGGLVSASAVAPGLPAEARSQAAYGVVAASHFTRHLIAKALHGRGQPSATHLIGPPSV